MIVVMVAVTLALLSSIVIAFVETKYTGDKEHGVFTGIEIFVKLLFIILAFTLASLLGQLLMKGMQV